MNESKMLVRALIRVGLCLVLAVSMAACASTPKHESAGEYVDSTAITTKVKARIFEDQALKSFDIKVETFKGFQIVCFKGGGSGAECGRGQIGEE